MKKKFNQILTALTETLNNTPIALIVLYGLLICGGVVLATWGVLSLLMYINANLEFFANTIFTIGIIVGLFWFWRSDRREKVAKEEKRKQDEYARLAEAERQRQIELADKKYKRLCGCLFTVVKSVAENIGLVTPDRPERLHSPGKILDAGNFLQYRYQSLKRTKEIDEQAIMHIVQEEIDNRMNSNEFGFKTTTFPYKGELYSIIQVTNVEDCGNYLHIDLAIACDAVCSYILNMAYARFEDANTFIGVPEV